jgi:hypothetical protein
MELCIYASEVAKLANMHTYESQENAIQKICERYNIDAVEQANKSHENALSSKERTQNKLEVLEKIVSEKNTELVRLKSIQCRIDDPNIKKDIARIECETSTASSNAKRTHEHLKISEEEVTKTKHVARVAIQEQAKTKACTQASKIPEITKAIQDNVKSAKTTGDALAPPDFREMLKKTAIEVSSTSNVPANTILRSLEGEVSCRMGDKLETKALEQYEQTQNKPIRATQKGFSKKFKTSKNNSFVLFGRTDGMSDDQVIETKNRKNRFLGVPLYEKVQVHVYMLLTGTTHSVLLENFDNKQRSHEIEFDNSFWNGTVIPNLNTAVDLVFERISGKKNANA